MWTEPCNYCDCSKNKPVGLRDGFIAAVIIEGVCDFVQYLLQTIVTLHIWTEKAIINNPIIKHF